MKLNTEQINKELLNLASKSYSPYSNFRVSCIIYLKNGQQIKGVNVENAAYSPSICGERTALSQMITQGYNKNDVDIFALYTDAQGLGSPCGVCRQTMAELLNLDQKISIFSQQGFIGDYTVVDLLPYSFTKDDLTK